MQEDTIQHLTDYVSKVVKENELDDFFAASTIEEQRGLFQKVSTGLEEVFLLVNNYTVLICEHLRVILLNGLSIYSSCLSREHLLATGWTEKQLNDIEAVHGDVNHFFMEHLHRVCLTLPVRDNFYLSLWTRGTRGFAPDSNPELCPPFLRRKNFHKLKVHNDCVFPLS